MSSSLYTDKIQFIEICAGAGGLSSGFINNGFVPLLLNDYDKTSCETLKLNHPDFENVVVCKKLQDVDFTAYKHQRLDLLSGGVPCQSFSIAGKQLGLDDVRGNLLLDFILLIEELKPRVFLIENVKGLLTHNKGETFACVLEKLENIGLYNIYYKVLNANDYGVPQNRLRLFIIGVEKEILQKYEFPEEEKYKPVLNDILGNEGSESDDDEKGKGYVYSEYKKNILKQIPEGGCWINLPLEIQMEYMKQSFHSGGGKRGIAKRLDRNKPCTTLTTSPCQKQTEKCHPWKTRPLNVREYARIQTFPDDYVFCGGLARQYRQLGNAVPIKLAEHIAKSIKKILEK
jgi:DNA (cytosine-5)-methyltransferase 1